MPEHRHLILATVTDINDGQVTYPYCTCCYSKLQQDQQIWSCSKCGLEYTDDRVEWRFRLAMTITDGFTICCVCGFGKSLQQYFGLSAAKFKEFLENIKSTFGDMELLNCLKRTFVGRNYYFGFKAVPTQKYGSVLKLRDITMTGSSYNSGTHHVPVYQVIPATDLPIFTVHQAIQNYRLSGENKENSHLSQGHRTQSDISAYRNNDTVNNSHSITVSFGQETALLSCEMSGLKDSSDMKSSGDETNVSVSETSSDYETDSVDVSDAGGETCTKGSLSKPDSHSNNIVISHLPAEIENGDMKTEYFQPPNVINTGDNEFSNTCLDTLHKKDKTEMNRPPNNEMLSASNIDSFSSSLNNSSLLHACEDWKESDTEEIASEAKLVNNEIIRNKISSVCDEQEDRVNKKCYVGDSSANIAVSTKGCEMMPESEDINAYLGIEDEWDDVFDDEELAKTDILDNTLESVKVSKGDICGEQMSSDHSKHKQVCNSLYEQSSLKGATKGDNPVISLKCNDDKSRKTGKPLKNQSDSGLSEEFVTIDQSANDNTKKNLRHTAYIPDTPNKPKSITESAYLSIDHQNKISGLELNSHSEKHLSDIHDVLPYSEDLFGDCSDSSSEPRDNNTSQKLGDVSDNGLSSSSMDSGLDTAGSKEQSKQDKILQNSIRKMMCGSESTPDLHKSKLGICNTCSTDEETHDVKFNDPCDDVNDEVILHKPFLLRSDSERSASNNNTRENPVNSVTTPTEKPHISFIPESKTLQINEHSPPSIHRNGMLSPVTFQSPLINELISKSNLFDGSGDLFGAESCHESSLVQLNVTDSQSYLCDSEKNYESKVLLYSAKRSSKSVQFARHLSRVKSIHMIDMEMKINCGRRSLHNGLPKSCLKGQLKHEEENHPQHSSVILQCDDVFSQDLFFSQSSINVSSASVISEMSPAFLPQSVNRPGQKKFIFPSLHYKQKVSTPVSMVSCEGECEDNSSYSNRHWSCCSESLFADSFEGGVNNINAYPESPKHNCQEDEIEENISSVGIKRKLNDTGSLVLEDSMDLFMDSPDLFGEWESSQSKQMKTNCVSLPVKRLFLD